MENYLIELMRKEKESGFQFDGIDKYDLAHKLIENIGDMDSEVRDRLIYVNLAHLFYDGHFDKTQLLHFFELLSSEKYLLYDMENNVSHSELTRSFTILQLVYLIYLHNKDPYLTNKQYMDFYVKFIQYFDSESVLQGYDEQVGWMHTIAHSADLIAQIVKSEEMNKKTLEEILTVIKKKFAISNYCYVSDEDERMVNAIINALDRNILEEDFLQGWVTSFGEIEKPKSYPEAYNFKSNVKNLLRSLYFRILDDKDHKGLVNTLKEVIISLEKR